MSGITEGGRLEHLELDAEEKMLDWGRRDGELGEGKTGSLQWLIPGEYARGLLRLPDEDVFLLLSVIFIQPLFRQRCRERDWFALPESGSACSSRFDWVGLLFPIRLLNQSFAPHRGGCRRLSLQMVSFLLTLHVKYQGLDIKNRFDGDLRTEI